MRVMWWMANKKGQIWTSILNTGGELIETYGMLTEILQPFVKRRLSDVKGYEAFVPNFERIFENYLLVEADRSWHY